MEGHTNITTIDTIKFNDIIGECKIEVFEKEGQIPHFHITGISNKFNCCVRIYDNHFFSHDNKCRDTLNRQQCIELNKWLSEINPRIPIPMTYWKIIVIFWENGNPECKFPDSLKVAEQPDYSKMSEFRDGM